MSGKGGHKHRRGKLERKRSQTEQKARASIARARGIFESKGQAWDPKDNPAQLAALNHAGRQRVLKADSSKF